MAPNVALLALWTTLLLWMCCDCTDAAAVEPNEWRPCRAAGHRRYDEEVLGKYGGGGGASYEEFAGGDEDDGESEEDEVDNQDGGRGYIRLPVDDKPKRGAVVKPYEKRQPEVHAASANSIRVETSLLRGETIELPTYVNVPVTLRCRFEPVDGTDDKFETVVEAMYPGHRDGPPPTPGSHASRILKQLMGSMDGWRGITHGSVRPVRRASGNRYGRLAWPAQVDEMDSGGDDPVGRQIAARQRAADRMRRYHDFRQDPSWPERFHGQSVRLLQRFDDGRPVVVRRLSENQLFEDQEAEKFYDRQIDGRRAERVYDRWVEPQTDELQQEERVDGLPQEERVDGLPQGETVDNLPQGERVDDLQQEEGDEDRLQGEGFDDRVQVDGRPAEQVFDRQVVPQIDELQQGERVDDFQQGEKFDDQQAEQVYNQQVDGRQAEQVFDQQQEVRQNDDLSPVDVQQDEIVDDLQQGKGFDDHLQGYGQKGVGLDDQLQRDGQRGGRIEDRAAAEEVDDRWVQGAGSLPADSRQVEDHVMAATIAPEIDTTVKSNFLKFRKGIPVRTFVEHSYTTDSA